MQVKGQAGLGVEREGVGGGVWCRVCHFCLAGTGRAARISGGPGCGRRARRRVAGRGFGGERGGEVDEKRMQGGRWQQPALVAQAQFDGGGDGRGVGAGVDTGLLQRVGDGGVQFGRSAAAEGVEGQRGGHGQGGDAV